MKIIRRYKYEIAMRRRRRRKSVNGFRLGRQLPVVVRTRFKLEGGASRAGKAIDPDRTSPR